jgi:hypothetical protein
MHYYLEIKPLYELGMEQHKRNKNYIGIPSTFKEIPGRKAWYT